MHDPKPFARRRLRRLLPAWVCLLAASVALAGEPPTLLRLEADDTPIAGDVKLARGVYRVADAKGDGVLRITQDDTYLDLTGVTLIGADEDTSADRFAGTAVEVVGARNVTIRGGRIRGYRVAVRAREAPGLVLDGIDASGNFRQRLRSTPEREASSDWLWPHENDADEWTTRYGAGFSLTSCPRAIVKRCRVRDGQNGLLLTRCERAKVHDNDFSFNSGWGIALYRSNRCEVSHNRCDWCVRGYSHGVYHRGQDSAGILVFEQCSYNVFVRNSATHGGDGFFLYAGHETTQKTGLGGCNGNLVFDNDFRFAVANGIEATFSSGNLFVRNDCSGSDHGIWAGYSRDSLFFANTCDDCLTAGISVEHGQENRYLYNRIRGGRVGIHLWWDLDEAFVNGVFGRMGSTDSKRNLIQGNRISGVDTALKLVEDRETTVRWNSLGARKTILDLGPGTALAALSDNGFRGRRGAEGDVPLLVFDRSGTDMQLPTSNSRQGALRGTGRFDPSTLPEETLFVAPRARPPAAPTVVGRTRTTLAPDMPVGRAQMRIDEWGPVDPRLPYVMPTRVRAGQREARIRLGGEGPWRLGRVTGRVRVVPAEGGRLPADVVLSPAPADGEVSALIPFRVAFELGGQQEVVEGHLLDATWDVRWFEWSTDPRKDEAAFTTLLAGDAKVRKRLPGLRFHWQGEGPEGVRPDRFATLATTRLWLPAGRYRLRTVSDDGIRVLVDGKRVTDDWTHHAPTEHTADVTLTAGWHDIRIEHFELTGWAALSFELEPLR